MQQEKRCENCKYYVAHYVNINTSFYKIGEGHCINSELNPPRKRNKFKLYENCAYWESNEDKKTERKESIKTVLRGMRDRLIEIEQILTDDI